ncbi:MAG TPA: alpha/beta fold hydrolase [candidate division Zixibacteria bacterium]|nr:alpha/beta fold hydrolase [candidate division Zixibacteria bacterium]
MEAKRAARMLFFLLVFVLLFLPLWGFYVSVRPPKLVSRITPENLGLAYEAVSFTTEDGVELSGWFIPATGGKTNKTVIGLHGYPADKGNILPVLAFLAARYNLMLFDFRYLGASGGRYTTIGARETRDLAAAVAFLRSRGITEVGVWGFSMGGAVALMAAPDLPEIRAVVSESSYARLDLLAPVLFRIPLLRYPLGWLTGLWARVLLGIDLAKVSPMESARRLRVPALILHSRNDHVIPFEHALLLKEALKENPRAEFWFADDLFHGQVGPDYERRIAGFFEASL